MAKTRTEKAPANEATQAAEATVTSEPHARGSALARAEMTKMQELIELLLAPKPIFEESGQKRLLGVQPNRNSFVRDCAVRVKYKTSLASADDNSKQTLDDQIERIQYQDGKLFRRGKDGFDVYQRDLETGIRKYLGTIQKPGFKFDKQGTLWYTEQLFDARKATAPSADTLAYWVTRTPEGKETRRKIAAKR